MFANIAAVDFFAGAHDAENAGRPVQGSRCGSFYGITAEYRKDASAFHEDLPKIFAVLAEKKIAPTFSLLDVSAALDALAAGGVAGKIVLEAQT